MILIELQPGIQREFDSHAALGEAILRGEVGLGARVYHQLRQQWLPVTDHPQFKRYWAERPLPPLDRTRWTFFSVDPGEAHRPATEEMRRRPAHERSETDAAAPAAVQEPARSPAWRRALGAAVSRFGPSARRPAGE